MAKYWREHLDPSRHKDHFHTGGGIPRRSLPLGSGYSYFVNVVGFTFEFATLEQIRQCLEFFKETPHGSSPQPVFEHEKGEWQSWAECLPATIRRGSKRERVTSALQRAVDSFARLDR